MFTLRYLKNTLVSALCVGSLGLASAHAVIEYDQDVTPDVIFGSGNTNGSFTTDRANGVELGLRGKLRHNAAGSPVNTFNSNGDGTYSFNAGVAPTQSFPTAEWSFEWSINSDWDGSSGYQLVDLSYALGLDSDPSLGTNFLTFDPINDVNPATGTVQWDHAIGDNSTGNGGGTSISNGVSDAAGYAANIAGNNVAQNSWKPHWFISSFDPTVDGTYDFYLAAFDGNGDQLASTNIQIVVGQGGSPVPDSGSAALLLSAGFLGLLGVRRFARRS